MSAQLRPIGRPAFAIPNPYLDSRTKRSRRPISPVQAVFRRQRALKHEMWISLSPNWQGQRHTRIVKVDAKTLTLGMDDRAASDTPKAAELQWRQMRTNASKPLVPRCGRQNRKKAVDHRVDLLGHFELAEMPRSHRLPAQHMRDEGT
jgi:hypothetical protein